MYKAVIFDFFGVVVNDQYNQWLHQRGLERTGPLSEIARRSDLAQIDINEFFTFLGGVVHQKPEVVEREFEQTVIVSREVLALIEILKSAGYKIGLLSNSNGPWLRQILGQYQLGSYFDIIVISAEVGFVKPQPQIYQVALDQLGNRAEEVLFIDDRLPNVEAAQALGITSLLYEGSQKLNQELKANGLKI